MDKVVSTKQYTVKEIEEMFNDNSLGYHDGIEQVFKCVLHCGMEIFKHPGIQMYYMYHFYRTSDVGAWKVTKCHTLASLVNAINEHHFNSHHDYKIIHRDDDV